KTRAQHLHRAGLVLVLRTLVLALHHETGREVRDADGGVGRVHALTTRARGAEGVDPQVLLVDLDLDVVRLRQDGHRRRRGVDPTGSLRLRHALDPVHAALVPEAAVDLAAADKRDDLLDPAQPAAAQVERLDLPAAPLRVAAVHAEQLRGEQRRLVAPGAGAYLEDDVLLVVRIPGKEQGAQLRLQEIPPGFQSLELLPGHRLHLLVAQKRLGLADLPQDVLELAELRDDLLELGVALGRLAVTLLVGDEGRIAHLAGQRSELRLDTLELLNNLHGGPLLPWRNLPLRRAGFHPFRPGRLVPRSIGPQAGGRRKRRAREGRRCGASGPARARPGAS